jgi:hypothetical protein
VARQLQDHEQRNLDEGPDRVVDEGEMAASRREEGIAPAVLQEQARQHQAEREERQLDGAADERPRAQRERAGGQAHEQRGAGAPSGGSPPPGQLRPAEPDQQRLDRQAPRRVVREAVGQVGQAEGAELRRPQSTGDVRTEQEICQAAHGLIREAPAQAAADPPRLQQQHG